MFLILLTFLSLLSRTRNDAVCDERLLVLELKQDLEDNGMLDCLRVIQPPQGYEETMEETNKRIAAQWDTQCSFEADYDWKKPLRELHGVSNLVDGIGDIVETDFDDQADMCEIIRASISAGKLKKITSDLVNIPLKILDYVDCAGEPEQSEICAVTGSSFFQHDTWYILLDGLSLSIDNKPVFIIEPPESQMPEVPEVQKDLIKKLEGPVTGDPNQMVTDISSDLSNNAKKLKGAFGEAKDQLKKMFKVDSSSEAPPKAREVDKTLIINMEELPCIYPNPTNEFNFVNQLLLKVPVAKERVLLGFVNVIVRFDTPCVFQTVSYLGSTEIISTKSAFGAYEMGSMPVAFVLKGRKKSENVFSVKFKTKCLFEKDKKKLCPEEEPGFYNYYIGILSLDTERKFWFTAPEKDQELDASAKEVRFPDLSIIFTLEKEWPVLVFYNIALENPSTTVTTILEIDTNKRPKNTLSSAKANPKATMTGFWAGVMKPGKHNITVLYTSDQKIPFDPSTNLEKVAALSILELPLGSVIYNLELTKLANLYVGAWLAMPDMMIDVDFITEKNVILMFHISLAAIYDKNEPKKTPFMARIKVDGKEIVHSRSSSTTSTLITCVGASLVHVAAGQHNFELEYFAGGKWKIDPETKDKGASLTLVVMDL